MKVQSPSSYLSTNDPERAYYALIDSGKVRLDPAQIEVLSYLQALHEELKEFKPKKRTLFSRKNVAPPQSLYIWGNVGRGKSMLMDIFYTTAPTEKKRRIHFHSFMQEVHAGLHRLRKKSSRNATVGDPVMLLVDEIASTTQLLCFDELQATDVADASLLFRLFEGLFNAGVVIVSTSNHPPVSLYTGGIQRERFNKFIELLEQKMKVVALSSERDYRMQAIRSLQQVYFWPLGEEANRFIEHAIMQITSNAKPRRETIEVQGRALIVQKYGDSLIAATFKELCENALGSADYLAIAKACDTLVLKSIPLLTPEKRNEAKRFVTLIDVLYENKIRLICTAEASAEQLYPTGDGSFEFQRTVSRLNEMQSEQYINPV